MLIKPYKDLREFITYLDGHQQLQRITEFLSPQLEMAAFSKKVLQGNGPALLFTNTQPHFIDNAINSSMQIQYTNNMPVLANLFGTTTRIALAMGYDNIKQLRELGVLLSNLKEPKSPDGFKDMLTKIPLLKQLFNMLPKIIKKAPVHDIILTKLEVDLSVLPIWTCHQNDIAPLITWGLVVTKGPNKKRQNLGIYRQQILNKNQVIMRWLNHRGGALDYLEHKTRYPDTPYPVSVVIGADPATILGAVTPVPDSLSEYQFAGLLRGTRTVLTKCITNDLHVPAYAEIVLEGYIYPKDTALEGPFGDHTGYYNEQEIFPVLTIETITMRQNAIYHSTYTDKPLDEPAVLGVALNEIFIPILQKQFPEIIDFYLPPEACSYRIAIVSIKKQYSGQAKRIMFGIWGFLRQFMYTKFIIVVDDDIDIRDNKDVMWAISTRVDPLRDTVLIDNTPIDYLDFASPVAGLGSKMGIDATNKIANETMRKWGTIITPNYGIEQKINNLYDLYFKGNI